MKKLFLISVLFPVLAFAGTRSLNEIFSPVYGKITKSCIRKQLATTGSNIFTTAMTANTMYMVSCDDNAGAGVACRCKQGGGSVSVGSSDWVLKAGHEYPVWADASNLYLSCQSFTGTPYVAACPFTP